MFKITVLALVLSGLCLGSAARADDAEAVALVKKLGGTVTRDEKVSGKPVIEVSLSHTDVTNAELKGLTSLKNLTTLDLGSTKVTGAGLKEIALLTNLTTLRLNNTRLWDTGLKFLAGLTNLTTLDLTGTNVTGAGLKDLAHLKNLTSLSLTLTNVTNEGLKELAPLANLTTLKLGFTQVTDAGLEALASLKNLTTLDLAVTHVTDTGLEALASLKSLTTLSLIDTKVTDAGLKELAPLKNLTTLNLERTKVTDAGRKKLQESLPKCKIFVSEAQAQDTPDADLGSFKIGQVSLQTKLADFKKLYPTAAKSNDSNQKLGTEVYYVDSEGMSVLMIEFLDGMPLEIKGVWLKKELGEIGGFETILKKIQDKYGKADKNSPGVKTKDPFEAVLLWKNRAGNKLLAFQIKQDDACVQVFNSDLTDILKERKRKTVKSGIDD